MKHHVVIGGAGFIGSWLVDEILKDTESKVTVIDNFISSERFNLSADKRVEVIEGSASKLDTFEKISTPIDTIYQLACFHGNQSSIEKPLDDFENSLKTTLITLEWVRKNSPKTRVIYSSAGCAIADKTWDLPTPVRELETTSLLHDSPYSISKITGEMYCIFYATTFNLDVVRVRFQNVYGPREILGAGVWRGTEHTIWRNVVPVFIWKMLGNQPIQIYGDGGRDFIFVEDLVHGIIQCQKLGKSGQVYNLATGIETKIFDVAKTIKSILSSQSEINQVERRFWDNSGRRLGEVSKSKHELDFHSLTNLNVGLEKTIVWTKSNFDIIKSTINKHSSND